MNQTVLFDALVKMLGGQGVVPPRRVARFLKEADKASFKQGGKEFVRHFRDLCALKPNEKVLDVGCGHGRIAYALTRYMNKKGRYEGLDVSPFCIRWCRKKIGSRFPNFQFREVNVFNRYYRPEGELSASRFKYPYPDESFDFVCLISVFTRMLPGQIKNYLAEINRVLKKGVGRCLVSFFFYKEGTGHRGKTVQFKHSFRKYRAVCRSLPEAAVAYDENYVLNLFEKNDLRVQQPIYYGSWRNGKNYLDFQDIVIAVKK